MDEFDGKVVYGEKRQQQKNAFKGHVEFLAPTVKVRKRSYIHSNFIIKYILGTF